MDEARAQNSPTKGRGKGKLSWLAKIKEPRQVSWKRGQPVEENSTQLSALVGRIGRDAKILPIHQATWKELPQERKDDAVRNITRYFAISDKNKEWVVDKLNKAWRDNKYELKRDYFSPFSTLTERLMNRPDEVPLESWRIAISIWADSKVAERAAKNSENRKKQKIPHTGGSKSYAKYAIEIEEDPERTAPPGTPASQVEVFLKTHTRKNNEPVTREAAAKMEQMKKLVAEANQEGSLVYSDGPDNIFCEVMGPEKRGHIRCYGKGTPKSVWGGLSKAKTCGDDEEVLNLKRKLEEMETELADMRAYFKRLKNQEVHTYSPNLSSESHPSCPN